MDDHPKQAVSGKPGNPDAPELLSKIDNPEQVRALNKNQLPQLANELREFLIQSVGKTGGHLSAGLGTVELTVALHYVFNTPSDRIVWDVGHQSYPHKILTGRRNQMNTMRQKGGLKGFPSRDESEYDTFGVGHSSTSISAALGMAIAAQRSTKKGSTNKGSTNKGSTNKGSTNKDSTNKDSTHNETKPRSVVAVIGDGAMTAGMAFEALNHAGVLDANLLVILNDNDMSISPNVGGLSNYLAKILSGKLYSTVKEGSKKVLSKMPSVWALARRAEEHTKGMVLPGTLFEELGFNYIGPIDGHDIDTLVTTLQNLKNLSGPQFLHIVTKKGKGFTPAEDDPCGYHGVSAFDPATGKVSISNTPGKQKGPTYTQVFGDWICDMAKKDDRLVAITPAMREGSGLVEYSQRYPDRYFDVGIAEQHSVTLAAGMACEGLKPVVAIYSTFLQRAYDQLIHDVAIQNLPVVFAIDRAGLVGPDGPTHAGSFDLSYMHCIPNMVVMAPADENECQQMLSTGFAYNGPSAIRYPRGTGPGARIDKSAPVIPIGKSETVINGTDIAIIAVGSMVQPAVVVGQQLGATVVNLRFVKPLDQSALTQVASKHRFLITIEENAISGGAGSAINDYLISENLAIPILNLGIPDRFIEQGSREECLAACGLDTSGIMLAIKNFLDQHTCGTLAVIQKVP